MNTDSKKIKASLKYLRIAPRKVRLVADFIKGKKIKDVETELRFMKKKSAVPLAKLVKSASANAKNNFNIESPEDLVIKSMNVDQGPVYKRYMPRARGSASLIKKKTSHITVTLSGGDEQKSKPTTNKPTS